MKQLDIPQFKEDERVVINEEEVSDDESDLPSDGGDDDDKAGQKDAYDKMR